MTQIDQFESAFKSAAKTQFHRQKTTFTRAAFVTDLDSADAEAILTRVQAYMGSAGAKLQWNVLAKGETIGVEALLNRIQHDAPDLIVTYRNLHSRTHMSHHSLGEHLDVLTQIATAPVMVIPHPNDGAHFDQSMRDRKTVMVVTDHLAGDHRLVNAAADFTEPNGTLWLSHIEDDAVFERYIDAISKIPAIDTDVAREEILRQLLKEPHDYIGTCSEALSAEGVRVEEIVQTGHHLKEYKDRIEEHAVDLLVMNTKDEEQLAMHGLAYPLVVEIRGIPLLML